MPLFLMDGLIFLLIKNHLPGGIGSTKGHIDREQRNIRSTKSVNKPTANPSTAPITNNIKAHDVMCSLINVETINKSYSDQTGKCPVQSSSGNQCIFVMYHYDKNSMYATPNKYTTPHTSSKPHDFPSPRVQYVYSPALYPRVQENFTPAPSPRVQEITKTSPAS